LSNFKRDVDEIIEKDDIKKDEAILRVLKRYIQESKNIRFEGDGYSQEWIQEAERRGLTNISSIPEALEAFLYPKTVDVFSQNNILSAKELKARKDIRLEQYAKRTQIESRVLGDLALNHIIPTAIKYQNTLLENISQLKNIYPEDEFNKMAQHQMDTVKRIANHINEIRNNVVNMINERKEANQIEDPKTKALAYEQKIASYFHDIRYHSDKLEIIIDDEIWPFPKYREMLFTR
jgi:glutamine synthetase